MKSFPSIDYVSDDDLNEITKAVTGSYLTAKLNTRQRLAVGIFCTLVFNESEFYAGWAENWISGKDTTITKTLQLLEDTYHMDIDDPTRDMKINVLTAILLYSPCINIELEALRLPFKLIATAVEMLLDFTIDINRTFGTPIHFDINHHIRQALAIPELTL